MTEALKQLPAPTTLSDLKPKIGERIQLESRSPNGRFSARLLGYKSGESLLVTPQEEPSAVPELADGQTLTARMICGNHIAAFSTRILKIQHDPFTYWHLEYPNEMEVRRIRRHTRVPVNLRVSLDEYDEGSIVGIWPCMGFCTDLSLLGACIEVTAPLGQVGDKLYLTVRVTVADIDQVILAPVVIRNVNQSEGAPVKVFRHGIEFLELDEDTRLILASFVYQQFLVETGHIDDLE